MKSIDSPSICKASLICLSDIDPYDKEEYNGIHGYSLLQLCIYFFYVVLKFFVAYREHYNMCYRITCQSADQGGGIAVQLPEQCGDQDADSTCYNEVYYTLKSKAYLFQIIDKGHHRESGAYHTIEQQIDIYRHCGGRKEGQKVRGDRAEVCIAHGSYAEHFVTE